MARDFASYKRLLQALLPRGRAWNSDDLTREQLLSGKAVELSRVDFRVDDLQDERDTRTVRELLGEFESELGLVTEVAPEITFSRASVAYKQNATRVESGLPRYETGHDGQTITIEDSTYNLIQAPSNFNDAVWTLINSGTGTLPVKTPNYGLAPDGTMTACRVQADKGLGNTTDDYSVMRQTCMRGQRSVWLKSNTGANQSVVVTGGAWAITITPVWKRYEFSDQGFSIYFDIGTQGGISTNQVIDVLVWHPQIESRIYATSWQDSADGGRAAEVCSGPSSAINLNQGAIACWVKLIGQNTTERHIFRSDQGGPWQYRIIGYQSGVISYRTYNGASIAALSTNPNYTSWLTDDVFHHVVVVWNGTNASIYLDGVLVAQGPVHNSNINSASFNIGSYQDGTNAINGLIDDFQIFNYALTANDVATLYNRSNEADVTRLVNKYCSYRALFDNNLSVSGNVYNLESRRNAVQAAQLFRGSLHKSYYISLAATLGHTITIDEYTPAWCGLAKAGTTCGDQSILFKWMVNVHTSPSAPVTNFDTLQSSFQKLCPAHTVIYFSLVGPGFSSGFSIGFNALPANTSTGGFSRGFSSGFSRQV